MGNGATMEYKYGTKNNWRRRVWNEVRSRTPNPGEALTLFLAGRDAADVEVATRKGFRAPNMIAVERDAKALAHLRSSGQLTVDGDLLNAIAAWPENRPVDVVLADFCGGLSGKLPLALFCASLRPAFCKTTLVVNLLRGRDPNGKRAQEIVEPFTLGIRSRLDALREDMLDVEDGGPPIPLHYCRALTEVPLKSRALALLVIFAALRFQDLGTEFSNRDLFLLEDWLAGLRPAMFSYRSTAGNQVFDTLVMRNEQFADFVTPESGRAMRDILPCSPAVKRSVSAVLAHHTRRSAC